MDVTLEIFDDYSLNETKRMNKTTLMGVITTIFGI